jgi:hypothetical protein
VKREPTNTLKLEKKKEKEKGEIKAYPEMHIHTQYKRTVKIFNTEVPHTINLSGPKKSTNRTITKKNR